uniref:Uncharacterized protein n=1 Tax=Philodina roseola TaxID=96448 RepID=B6S357_PHIRO|nr:hypothetical protein [Philodina roseola]
MIFFQVTMDRIIGEVLGHAIGAVIGAVLDATLKSATNDVLSKKHKSQKGIKHASSFLPTPSAPVVKHNRAVLISSSAISFGNECERLVNIAFETSQTFVGMMSTFGEVSAYIRKELEKHYPDTHFHIVIGENKVFGFCVDDGEYFAEIEQERYRVLIFSSKRHPQTKCDDDHHDANSHFSFVWN